MEPETLASLAFQLAASTPKHLGRPTTPPLAWGIHDDRLKIILADGRAIYAPLDSSSKLDDHPTISHPSSSSSSKDLEIYPPLVASNATLSQAGLQNIAATPVISPPSLEPTPPAPPAKRSHHKKKPSPS
jgi:hypothetical protein